MFGNFLKPSSSYKQAMKEVSWNFAHVKSAVQDLASHSVGAGISAVNTAVQAGAGFVAFKEGSGWAMGAKASMSFGSFMAPNIVKSVVNGAFTVLTTYPGAALAATIGGSIALNPEHAKGTVKNLAGAVVDAAKLGVSAAKLAGTGAYAMYAKGYEVAIKKDAGENQNIPEVKHFVPNPVVLDVETSVKTHLEPPSEEGITEFVDMGEVVAPHTVVPAHDGKPHIVFTQIIPTSVSSTGELGTTHIDRVVGQGRDVSGDFVWLEKGGDITDKELFMAEPNPNNTGTSEPTGWELIGEVATAA